MFHVKQARMRWYYDDKVQMLLNTWFPRRKRFRAYWNSELSRWVDGRPC